MVVHSSFSAVYRISQKNGFSVLLCVHSKFSNQSLSARQTKTLRSFSLAQAISSTSESLTSFVIRHKMKQGARQLTGDESLYLTKCLTNLVIALHSLSLLFCNFINTTAYHLDSLHLHGQINTSSVTRFGDLMDFGQLFKAFGNNEFAPISPIRRQFL